MQKKLTGGIVRARSSLRFCLHAWNREAERDRIRYFGLENGQKDAELLAAEDRLEAAAAIKKDLQSKVAAMHHLLLFCVNGLQELARKVGVKHQTNAMAAISSYFRAQGFRERVFVGASGGGGDSSAGGDDKVDETAIDAAGDGIPFSHATSEKKAVSWITVHEAINKLSMSVELQVGRIADQIGSSSSRAGRHFRHGGGGGTGGHHGHHGHHVHHSSQSSSRQKQHHDEVGSILEEFLGGADGVPAATPTTTSLLRE